MFILTLKYKMSGISCLYNIIIYSRSVIIRHTCARLCASCCPHIVFSHIIVFIAMRRLMTTWPQITIIWRSNDPKWPTKDHMMTPEWPQITIIWHNPLMTLKWPPNDNQMTLNYHQMTLIWPSEHFKRPVHNPRITLWWLQMTLIWPSNDSKWN